MAAVTRRVWFDVLTAAAFTAAAGAARAEPTAGVFTSVREVADSYLLPGPYPPVRLEAVVTGRYPNGSLVIRDETGATFVHRDSETTFATVAIGDRIRVQGVVYDGVFTNGIKEATVETLATGPRPPPRRASLAEFVSGGCYHDFISLAGVVRSARRHDTLGTILGLDVEGRLIEARCVPPLPEAEERRPIDAEVEVAGFGGGEVNVVGHLLRPYLRVLDPADVQVVTPAPADPFAAEPVPLARLARVPRSGHRVKVTGVAAARGGLGGGVFLADDDQGLFVEPAVLDDTVRGIVPGDRVEAAGFPTTGPASLHLGEAVVRVVGKAAVPPARVLPAEVSLQSPEDWGRMHRILWPDALPVQLQMTVISRVDREGGSELIGTNGLRQMRVRCFVPDRPAAAAVPGSVVAARGVYRVTATDRDLSRPLPDAIDLWAGSAADVRVVRMPPWWMRPDVVRSLAAALVACVAAVAAAAAWVFVLRRQVRRQVGVIEGQLKSEAVLEERQRIAREFHDSLEQDLAVMALRLEADAAGVADGAARRLFDQQRAAVLRLQDESHQFVWDLRDAGLADRPLGDSLEELIADVQRCSPVPIALVIQGRLPNPALPVRQQLLRIVREAVANAVSHAHAAKIAVTATIRDGRVSVEVRDDGEGFDVAASERMAGHFGLRGMRERAWRLGADLAIESQPRSGSRVALSVDVSAAAADGTT
jgi:signal transduction histidine kinase